MSRTLRFVLASLCIVIVGACVRSTGADGSSDSAMFRGGPAHPGVAEGPAGARYGGIRWRAATTGPVRSTPAIVDGTVYVGSGDGAVYALDLETGETVWRAEVAGPVDASPAVAGGLVLAADRAGTFFALDRETGEQRWRVESGPLVPMPWGGESGDLYTASPAVVGSTAVFGGGDGSVYAIDVDSGEVLWTHATDGRVRASPAIVDGVVYTGGTDGSMYALALEDGRRLWRFDTRGRTLDSSEYGYDRRTITSSPTVSGGIVYFGSRDGALYAVDAATGRFRWRGPHDETSWSIASPAVVDGVVLDASSDAAFIRGVDAETGEEVWRVETSSVVWPSPVVAGGVAWWVTASGTLHGIDPASGEVLERVELGESTLGSPWIADGTMVLGTNDGSVLAVRLVDGPTLTRAVYWDSTSVEANTVPGSRRVRDWFVDRGYELLDADGLGSFLEARSADGAPSVVVFAQDDLPSTVAPAVADTVLFRRWLDAGGKAVWLGMPPMIWPPGPEGRAYAGIDRSNPERLLGVGHEGSMFDRWGARITDEGRRWGLERWWLSRWSAPAEAVDEVLALDENGRAAAWRKAYHDRPGSGFFRVEGRGDDPGRLADVAAVAERFP